MENIFIDTTGLINNVHNRSDMNYLTCLNAVETFNKYFEKNLVHPIVYKFKFQGLTFNESYEESRNKFGLFYASLFILYLDSI